MLVQHIVVLSQRVAKAVDIRTLGKGKQIMSAVSNKNKYGIEMYVKDDYGANRYAIIRVGYSYLVAFEDDYGVIFEDDNVIDTQGIYGKIRDYSWSKGKSHIRKSVIPKKDWEDMMSILRVVINSKRETKCYDFDQFPITEKRIDELVEKYNLGNCIQKNSVLEREEREEYREGEEDEYDDGRIFDDGLTHYPDYYIIDMELIEAFSFRDRIKFNGKNSIA